MCSNQKNKANMNMGKQTIRKGRHRPFNIIPACFREMPVNIQSSPQVRYVKFTSSCRYDLGGEDQNDWNKLYGFCRGILGIHEDSVRVVWRYNKDTGMIELGLYRYMNGERIFPKHIFSVRIDEDITVKLEFRSDDISLNIITSSSSEWDFVKSPFDCKKSLLFGCGLYFGGNRTSPHDITIEYSKE